MYGRGAGGYAPLSLDRTRNSRPMSCAVLTWLPNGGRRRTNSWPPLRKRYVRLEWPCGNCSTVSGPEAPGKCCARYASRVATGSSSPGRRGAVVSRSGFMVPSRLAGSPVGPECGVLQVRERVEAVEGEPVLREYEFGQR